MLKKIIKIIIPYQIIKIILNFFSLIKWKQRNFLGHAPQFVKKNVLLNYGVKNAIWVETGTFEGSTIRSLRRLEELVSQLASASKSIGNLELQAKFEKGSELLKRDIVFCSSLYL